MTGKNKQIHGLVGLTTCQTFCLFFIKFYIKYNNFIILEKYNFIFGGNENGNWKWLLL
jgi:hypothetical protein